MKPQLFILLSAIAIFGLTGCETVIDADLDTGPTQLSVEATLTDQPGQQQIRLTQTAPYFNNSAPPAATGATVRVADDAGQTFNFTDADNDGLYVWQPATNRDTLGRVGRTYSLSITYQDETYRAVSRLNRVPNIDSLIFRKESINPLSTTEGYQAEFYARDVPGAVDYYRIKFFRNGTLQNRPGNIIISQDGSFRGSANTDGLVFIRPIRQSINPDSLYRLNETVRVDLESISPEAYIFWENLRNQITNGGLFATPPANVPTNVLNTNPNGRKATGFFITSAVRTRTARVTPENVRQ
ncbi:DUF4249 domain-containing protein [Spirosoma montaniterrae]|uniref:DUF4249 domain-containing protein n=1 Tax=Spirosoma montaniterrae TaxID=1178516 RepID=A0A1P9X286_9BACT|nr:DUF4249 domain-containing protein [Spirosoma montaniterrae]AQG81742.1 hypothetical protein AWR27_22015 [Spirosoma montaniterrae]